MPKHKPLPSQERLQELFEYSVITGELTWKKKPHPLANRVVVGAKATNSNGHYLQTIVDGQYFVSHRIVWMLVTGEDPGDLEVDHKDLDKLNNSWHNLRLCTRAQNQGNRTKRSDNQTGFKGVYPLPRLGKYAAQIQHEGFQQNLGLFPTPEEAHAAYCKAALELHGDFARTH